MPTVDSHLTDLLPLREPTFYILLSLASGEKHGYTIIRSVEQLSRGKHRLSTGTLYEALARMLEQELIERVDDTHPPGITDGLETGQRGRTRKVYRLTDKGRRLLAADMVRMRELVSIALGELGSEWA